MVAMVLTDPPFSAAPHNNAKSNRGDITARKAIDFAAIDFAAIDFADLRAVVAKCGELCHGWLVSFMDWRHIAQFELDTPAPWQFMRFGVWVKTNPMPQLSADRPANGWDGIVYLRHATAKPGWHGGGKHGNWVGPVVKNGDHPTGKPIQLVRQLVERFTMPGDVVLDPFMGSGTSLLAAKEAGRQAIGIELEERYCEIAAKRLSQGVFNFEEAST